MTSAEHIPVTETDPSFLAWELLRDRDVAKGIRRDAFERLLALNRGWWGAGTLLRFTQSIALITARKVLRPHGFSVDQLDWEGLGTDALLLLFERADRVERSPAAWLRGVISNLVHQAARRNWSHLATEPMGFELEELNKYQYSYAPDKEVQDRDSELPIHPDVLGKLDPSLRSVAQLLIEGHMSRPELCAELGISHAALRKRLERMRRALDTHVRQPTIETDRQHRVSLVNSSVGSPKASPVSQTKNPSSAFPSIHPASFRQPSFGRTLHEPNALSLLITLALQTGHHADLNIGNCLAVLPAIRLGIMSSEPTRGPCVPWPSAFDRLAKSEGSDNQNDAPSAIFVVLTSDDGREPIATFVERLFLGLFADYQPLLNRRNIFESHYWKIVCLPPNDLARVESKLGLVRELAARIETGVRANRDAYFCHPRYAPAIAENAESRWFRRSVIKPFEQLAIDLRRVGACHSPKINIPHPAHVIDL